MSACQAFMSSTTGARKNDANPWRMTPSACAGLAVVLGRRKTVVIGLPFHVQEYRLEMPGFDERGNKDCADFTEWRLA